MMLQPTCGAFTQQEMLLLLKEEVLFTMEKSIFPMTLILKSAPLFSVYCSCFVSWKNVILAFGGISNKQDVFHFDPSTNACTTLGSSFPPLELAQSSYIVLPNMNVLIAGSSTQPASYQKFFFFFFFFFFHVGCSCTLDKI